MWNIYIIIISALSKDVSNVSYFAAVLLEIFCCEKNDNAKKAS